ncbi:hypothetical protein EVAR_30823_1 [Eumeta japonica]|uniref:Uncharacterized protein n=1 Tax=Eumeta variegata TaxID=151549 RepID=A0A4C1SHD4_EUMVA|nr:hypothetical protein EVAR_30823_1 [Eumeta japonica]
MRVTRVNSSAVKHFALHRGGAAFDSDYDRIVRRGFDLSRYVAQLSRQSRPFFVPSTTTTASAPPNPGKTSSIRVRRRYFAAGFTVAVEQRLSRMLSVQKIPEFEPWRYSVKLVAISVAAASKVMPGRVLAKSGRSALSDSIRAATIGTATIFAPTSLFVACRVDTKTVRQTMDNQLAEMLAEPSGEFDNFVRMSNSDFEF